MEQTIFTALKVEDLIGMIADRIMGLLSLNTQEKNKEPLPEELITIEDIQRIFNVSKVTVHKWKKKGLLPFYKMNRKVYFKKSEVINAMTHKKRKMEV